MMTITKSAADITRREAISCRSRCARRPAFPEWRIALYTLPAGLSRKAGLPTAGAPLQSFAGLTSAAAVQALKNGPAHVSRSDRPVARKNAAERPHHRVTDTRWIQVGKARFMKAAPAFPFPANVYIPRDAPPFPGVLFQMGHTGTVKPATPINAPVRAWSGSGSWCWLSIPWDRASGSIIPDETGRHSRLGMPTKTHVSRRQMLLVGDELLRLQLWDADPQPGLSRQSSAVDPARLASTGQSGGGTLTMLLARSMTVSAQPLSSAGTPKICLPPFFPPGSIDDAEQDFVGSGPPRRSTAGTCLHPFAPKPLLISVSDKDFFGTYSPNYINDGGKNFRRLKRCTGRWAGNKI